MAALPVLDVAPLRAGRGPTPGPGEAEVARALDAACRATGFFLITGHGVDPGLLARLDAAARRFFALPEDRKAEVAMARGGRAWRGWFPEGGELTAGRPDRKEGLYLGQELPADDPRVLAGRPLHGPNLFPDHDVADLRPAVLAWIDEMTELGHALARGVSLGLGLPADHLRRHLTADPTVLFRIFRYPPAADDEGWGVAEHTDYGLLTLLATDGTPGLEVKVQGEWVPAPADADLVICNLGDMLDRVTSGRYRSNPHRVRNHAGADRYSLPFFLDPGWNAVVQPLVIDDGWQTPLDADARWDKANLRDLGGTYGKWLTAKVSKVFPDLAGHHGM